MLACCKRSNGCKVCILRGLQFITSPLGDKIMNEVDCPLLELSHTIFTTLSSSVLKAVSVMHECSTTCHFVSKQIPQNIERESVSVSKLEFEHDFSSNLIYCLNLYVLHGNIIIRVFFVAILLL